ncbi:MAG: DUF1376 domain-containing protein [Pseudomonadota bacterium]
MQRTRVYPAWMPLFVDDFLADTGHLTPEEVGAYFRLLVALWRSEHVSLPHVDRDLAGIVGVSLRKWQRGLGARVLGLCVVREGRVSHKRVLRERMRAQAKSASRAASGARGGRRSQALPGERLPAIHQSHRRHPQRVGNPVDDTVDIASLPFMGTVQ